MKDDPVHRSTEGVKPDNDVTSVTETWRVVRPYPPGGISLTRRVIVTSVWQVAERHELLRSAVELEVVEHKGRRHSIQRTPSALWLVSEWAEGARIACRLAFSTGELDVVGTQQLTGRS